MKTREELTKMAVEYLIKNINMPFTPDEKLADFALQVISEYSYSFWFMRDNHTFIELEGTTLNEIADKAIQAAKDNPWGMVCPATVFINGEEKGKVGKSAHVDNDGNVDINTWKEKLLKDEGIKKYFALQVLKQHESQPEPQHEFDDFMKEPLDASIKRRAELYNSPEIDAIMSDITPEQYEATRREMMGETFIVRALRKRGTDKLYRFYDNLNEWIADDYVFMFYDNSVSVDEFAVNIPPDAELVELECRVIKIIEP